MGPLEGGGEGSAIPSSPRIITHSTTSFTSFNERHAGFRRHFDWDELEGSRDSPTAVQ
jgi:hypothetical protein